MKVIHHLPITFFDFEHGVEMSSCPCGSEKNYDDCCGVYIKGAEKAPTAESLMRSRYTAYTMCEVEYINETHDPSSRSQLDLDEVKDWAGSSKWNGLQIKNVEGGLEEDNRGTVEFIALFDNDAGSHEHHELSEFEKIDGNWYFVEGKVFNQPIMREVPKVGRNEPCPCNSGKKYKKCCGA